MLNITFGFFLRCGNDLELSAFYNGIRCGNLPNSSQLIQSVVRRLLLFLRFVEEVNSMELVLLGNVKTAFTEMNE